MHKTVGDMLTKGITNQL